MTKKHFIALADAIRYQNGTSASFSKGQIDILAHFCSQSNPNFNRTRWLDYIAGKCGSNGGAIKTHPRTGMAQYNDSLTEEIAAAS